MVDIRRNAAPARFHVLSVVSGRAACTQRFTNHVLNSMNAIIKHRVIFRPLSPAILFMDLYTGLNPTCNCREKTKEQNRKFSKLPKMLDTIGVNMRKIMPKEHHTIHFSERLNIVIKSIERTIFESMMYKKTLLVLFAIYSIRNGYTLLFSRHYALNEHVCGGKILLCHSAATQ